MNHQLHALYGLKFNPFLPDIPTEALFVWPALQNFCWRIEHTLIHEGGFALISGAPGTGKSAALRVLQNKLQHVREVQIGCITHPSSSISDFYRELGDLFGVPLRQNNRWIGFKGLRERWLNHFKSTLIRPVLFIDEAQEVPTVVLNELRLLTSIELDSKILLSVVFSGDKRLPERLMQDALIPLASRIRIKLNTATFGHDQLSPMLQHLLDTAGNSALITPELMQALCDHAMGNSRALCVICQELLAAAVKKELPRIDDKLFFECFPTMPQPKKR